MALGFAGIFCGPIPHGGGNMLPTPTRYRLAAGAAEGDAPLTAFDAALLAAGLGNVNLIKVSSILPPGARHDESLAFPRGALVPTAYGTLTSSQPGQQIAAAVAIGIGPDGFGVIMEYSGTVGAEEAESAVRQMAVEAMQRRGLPIVEIRSKAIAHTVQKTGCAFAAVALGY